MRKAEKSRLYLWINKNYILPHVTYNKDKDAVSKKSPYLKENFFENYCLTCGKTSESSIIQKHVPWQFIIAATQLSVYSTDCFLHCVACVPWACRSRPLQSLTMFSWRAAGVAAKVWRLIVTGHAAMRRRITGIWHGTRLVRVKDETRYFWLFTYRLRWVKDKEGVGCRLRRCDLKYLCARQ